MEIYKYYCDKCGKELALIAEREKGIEARKAFIIEYPKMCISKTERVIERQEKVLDLCEKCFLKLQNEIASLLESEVTK